MLHALGRPGCRGGARASVYNYDLTQRSQIINDISTKFERSQIINDINSKFETGAPLRAGLACQTILKGAVSDATCGGAQADKLSRGQLATLNPKP